MFAGLLTLGTTSSVCRGLSHISVVSAFCVPQLKSDSPDFPTTPNWGSKPPFPVHRGQRKRSHTIQASLLDTSEASGAGLAWQEQDTGLSQ